MPIDETEKIVGPADELLVAYQSATSDIRLEIENAKKEFEKVSQCMDCEQFTSCKVEQ